MKRTAALLAVAFAAFAHAASPYPVCIVGAGPAGLTIANRLESQGRQTVIFEKNATVGGKCQAFYDEKGLFHPMGALLFSNDTYTETLPIVDASGVPSRPFSYTFRPWLYNWTTGEVHQSLVSPDQVFFLVKNEVEKYTTFWNDEFAPNMTSVGYKNGVPKEYTVSTSQWLSDNGYLLLPTLFSTGMVSYGYGDIRETPIIYMLQYFTPDILLFFAGQHPGYIIDFHEVFVHYALSVKGPINLNTHITNISRSGDHPVITYRNQTGSVTNTQPCSELVLAFPPILRALEAANLDLSEDERTVFSPVGMTKYWSGAVRVAIPDGSVFTAEGSPPDAAGEPVSFLRLINESDIATTWSWDKYRSNKTLEQAKVLLKETISKFNRDPTDSTAQPQNITDADVKDFQEWDYFPHYDQPELEGEFYQKFNALQGTKKTYYASGFNGFETVEFAIRAGKDVVNTYFANLTT